MAGNVKAEGLLFIRKKNIFGPLFYIREGTVTVTALRNQLFGTKQRLLTDLFLLL